MIQFSTQWAYSFSENRFLSPSCSSCQTTFMLSSASASLGNLSSWVRFRQSSGCWLSLETPRGSPQLILKWWDRGTQFKKPALGFDFLSNHLEGRENIAFSKGSCPPSEKPETSGAAVGCRGEGRIPGQVEDIVMSGLFACEICRGRKTVRCSWRESISAI